MMLDAKTQASYLDLLCFRYQAEGLVKKEKKKRKNKVPYVALSLWIC